MAKRRRKKVGQGGQPSAAPQVEERKVPKFEMGVKGDEFDVAYTRAAARESEKVSTLMSGLTRESKRTAVNLVCFAVLSLLILFMSLSFVLLSRDSDAPKLRPEKLADGSFLSELSEYYSESLPFGDALRTLGARLGFGDGPAPHAEEPEEPDEPAVTTAATTASEPPATTTTPPTTTVPPTTVEPEETTELVVPDTERMYAGQNLNIRLEPSTDSIIMGYFYTNERIDVIEIRDDGWASIWYNNMVLYVDADGISSSRVKVTASTTMTEPEPEPDPDLTDIDEPIDEPTTDFEDVTTAPEETEPEPTAEDTTVAEVTTSETSAESSTTSISFNSPEEEWAYHSRMQEMMQSAATASTSPETTTTPPTTTPPPTTTTPPPETTPEPVPSAE